MGPSRGRLRLSTRPNTDTKAALRAGLMPILEEMTQRGDRCRTAITN